MSDKTIAEKLREACDLVTANAGCLILRRIATGDEQCPENYACTTCMKKSFCSLAEMIETEQAELRADVGRAETYAAEREMEVKSLKEELERALAEKGIVDLAALDLLCDKLDCGDVKRRSIAAQIRKAMKGSERTKTEHDGVDVDALLKLTERMKDSAVYDVYPMTLTGWVNAIRGAVKGANPSKSTGLPEGIEWPRFTDGELVKFGDEVDGIEGKIGTITLYTHGFVLNGLYYHKGEPAMRPEPEVLDADGVPIKVGDTLYNDKGTAFRVDRLKSLGNTIKLTCIKECAEFSLDPVTLTHRKPDTVESVARDMAEEIGTKHAIELRPYIDRLRKLMGGDAR